MNTKANCRPQMSSEVKNVETPSMLVPFFTNLKVLNFSRTVLSLRVQSKPHFFFGKTNARFWSYQSGTGNKPQEKRHTITQALDL